MAFHDFSTLEVGMFHRSPDTNGKWCGTRSLASPVAWDEVDREWARVLSVGRC